MLSESNNDIQSIKAIETSEKQHFCMNKINHDNDDDDDTEDENLLFKYKNLKKSYKQLKNENENLSKIFEDYKFLNQSKHSNPSHK